jgi:hypothetical protein
MHIVIYVFVCMCVCRKREEHVKEKEVRRAHEHVQRLVKHDPACMPVAILTHIR